MRIKDVELQGEALEQLGVYLCEKFGMVVTARSTQIDDKALRWEKNYAATPAQEVRTTPFYRASNFVPQLIRMHTDILAARVLGIVFGTKPFWMVKSLVGEIVPHEALDAIGQGLNYISECDLEWFETVDQIVNQAFQKGTLIEKGIWNSDERSYLDSRGNFIAATSEGMEYEPICFEDFWPYPITAKNCKKAEILFHRIRLTERDVRNRVESKKWNVNGELLFKGELSDPLAESRAEESGITLSKDVTYPYNVVECWLDWKIGSSYKPIVVVMNPQLRGSKAILRAYYNFMPDGERPFIEFVPMPRTGSFYGYSVPEILEQSQEEAAQIHNARRDANVIANVPGWKKKKWANVPNPSTDWYPGCVLEVDEMDDLEPLVFPMKYNDMIDEEQFVNSLAERYIGISPSMQGFGAGQSAGKRGVYATGATLALLSEGNRRLDIFIRRLRYPFHRMGNLTLRSYKQFNPGYFDAFGEKGAQIRQALEYTDKKGRLMYDLAASDASSNREIDRQNLLQMANVMAGYYEKIVEGGAMLQQIPPGDPMRNVLLMVLDGAKDLADRLLFAFDVGDRKRLLPDAARLLGGGAGPAGPDGQGAMLGAPGGIQAPGLQELLTGIAASAGGNFENVGD